MVCAATENPDVFFTKQNKANSNGLFELQDPAWVQPQVQRVCISPNGTVPPQFLKPRKLWFYLGQPAQPMLTSTSVAH